MRTVTSGTVKWFDGKKGYGFITPDDGGEDVFVHFSSLNVDGFKTLEGVDRVTFDINESGNGKLQAENVTPVSPAHGDSDYE